MSARRALITGITDQDGSYLADHVGLEWEPHVRIDDALKRPAEVDLLVGDATKAKRVLGWEPTTRFEQLIRVMVEADLALLGR